MKYKLLDELYNIRFMLLSEKYSKKTVFAVNILQMFIIWLHNDLYAYM